MEKLTVLYGYTAAAPAYDLSCLEKAERIRRQSSQMPVAPKTTMFAAMKTRARAKGLMPRPHLMLNGLRNLAQPEPEE